MEPPQLREGSGQKRKGLPAEASDTCGHLLAYPSRFWVFRLRA